MQISPDFKIIFFDHERFLHTLKAIHHGWEVNKELPGLDTFSHSQNFLEELIEKWATHEEFH